jgi:hypothetical protein
MKKEKKKRKSHITERFVRDLMMRIYVRNKNLKNEEMLIPLEMLEYVLGFQISDAERLTSGYFLDMKVKLT